MRRRANKKLDLVKEYKRLSRENFKDRRLGSFVIDQRKFKKPKYKEDFVEDWDEIDEKFWEIKRR